MRRVLLFYRESMTVHEKLDRLALIAPEDAKAIDAIVSDALKRRWAYFTWWPKRGRQRVGQRPT